MTRLDTVCSASRLLDMGTAHGQIDRIMDIAGSTREDAEEISDEMHLQSDFTKWLDWLDTRYR